MREALPAKRRDQGRCRPRRCAPQTDLLGRAVFNRSFRKVLRVGKALNRLYIRTHEQPNRLSIPHQCRVLQRRCAAVRLLVSAAVPAATAAAARGLKTILTPAGGKTHQPDIPDEFQNGSPNVATVSMGVVT